MDKNVKQIKPMICPVCGKFYFTELNDVAIDQLGLTPNTTQCSMCGWFYDLEQMENPNLEKQANVMSLNQYKKWYESKINDNPKWAYYQDFIGESTPHVCPVCGEHKFSDELSYEICPICGWEDNGFEDSPDEKPGPFSMSFREKKEWFANQRQNNPKFRFMSKPHKK